VTEPVAVAGSVAVSVTGRPSTKEERGVERVNEGAEVEDARTEKGSGDGRHGFEGGVIGLGGGLCAGADAYERQDSRGISACARGLDGHGEAGGSDSRKADGRGAEELGDQRADSNLLEIAKPDAVDEESGWLSGDGKVGLGGEYGRGAGGDCYGGRKGRQRQTRLNARRGGAGGTGADPTGSGEPNEGLPGGDGERDRDGRGNGGRRAIRQGKGIGDVGL